MSSQEKVAGLGCIEYYGEVIPITWNDYLSLIWNMPSDIVVLKVPVEPKK